MALRPHRVEPAKSQVDPREQVRPLGHRPSHQHAARACAFGDQPVAARIPVGDEPLGTCDEVFPAQVLGGLHGRAMPFVTKLASSPRVADGVADSVRSEEHTSELQSLMRISYAVFCLKKKNKYTSHAQPLY